MTYPINFNIETKEQTVLVVDDDFTNIDLLEVILKRAGYQVLSACNGFQALEIVQNELPDLILLDIIMPEISGYEICQRLKANEKTMDIPILFISASTEKADRFKAFNYGGFDYISKPFQIKEILARVKTHITLNESRKYLKQKNYELNNMLKNMKTLQGILSICIECKRIRNKNANPENIESWTVLEKYLSEHTFAQFSHGYCPECADRLYAELELTELKKTS